nr:hypothetical protein [Lactiplantibacillus plantarum]
MEFIEEDKNTASSGWSGNLGFKMPENWSFDQFNEFTGASTGIDMDQVAVSGKDNGVSKVTKVNMKS